nr:MAG TPA: hypothetical protein [Caudoviricetes sp.]
MAEVKGSCPRNHVKLLTGCPLYFHDTIISHLYGSLWLIFT